MPPPIERLPVLSMAAKRPRTADKSPWAANWKCHEDEGRQFVLPSHIVIDNIETLPHSHRPTRPVDPRTTVRSTGLRSGIRRRHRRHPSQDEGTNHALTAKIQVPSSLSLCVAKVVRSGFGTSMLKCSAARFEKFSFRGSKFHANTSSRPKSLLSVFMTLPRFTVMLTLS